MVSTGFVYVKVYNANAHGNAKHNFLIMGMNVKSCWRRTAAADGACAGRTVYGKPLHIALPFHL